MQHTNTHSKPLAGGEPLFPRVVGLNKQQADLMNRGYQGQRAWSTSCVWNHMASCVFTQHFPLPTAAVCSILARTSDAKVVQYHLQLPSTTQTSVQMQKRKRVHKKRPSDQNKTPSLLTFQLLSTRTVIFILNSPLTY